MSFLRPEQIINQITIKPNYTAADFGAGSGGFSLPLAKKLKEGRVYAIDIQAETLSALEGAAKAQGLYNIKVILGDLEKEQGSKLDDSSVDLVFIANLLFQSQDRIKVLQEAKRILKPGGKMAIIDWNQNYFFGPKEKAVKPESLDDEVRSLGLKELKRLDAGSSHFCLLIEKP
ncbi:MAG TPA: class I SAM-dependent methyltransferase [Candidatus Pacearchaeota archaeon]|nr:class I SAM-dependent methyltransferase [Candidatus Pacearchaeota archaeon]